MEFVGLLASGDIDEEMSDILQLALEKLSRDSSGILVGLSERGAILEPENPLEEEPPVIFFSIEEDLIEERIIGSAIIDGLPLLGWRRIKSEEDIRNLIERYPLLDVNGAFNLFKIENGRILIARDHLGIRPFFIGARKGTRVISSSPRFLWCFGILEYSLPPRGALLSIEKSSIIEIARNEPRISGGPPTPEEFLDMLRRAVLSRLEKKASCLISGGLDSSLILKLLLDGEGDIEAITVGVEGSSDMESSERLCEEMGVRLRKIILAERDVRDLLRDLLISVGIPDPLHVSIGVPLYLGLRNSSSRDVFLGQGADEMFGGYARYERLVEREGYDALGRRLEEDTLSLQETNLFRDCSLARGIGRDLHLPYLDRFVLERALAIPPEMKLVKSDGGWVRKWFLRKVARIAGLPDWIVERPKKAVQYSSGAHRVLREIARKEGLELEDFLKKEFLEAREEFLER